MRVLQLTQRFPPAIGGVEEHVLHLARKLREDGVDVRVATTDLRRDVPFERLPPSKESHPFPVVRCRAHKFAEVPHGLAVAAPSMLFEALDHRTDIVHAHSYGYFPTWVGSFARSLDGASLVITPHSDEGRNSLARTLFDGAVARLTLRRADRLIAISQSEARRLISLGVHEDRVVMIPNGIDLREFEGLPERKSSPETVTGLFVGRIYPRQKGLETLVRAMAYGGRGINVRIRIVGEDWGGVSSIRSLAARLGVSDRFSFCGTLPRHELVQEYARADFLVLPSLFEPFGIVLLEAMAARLPVVASRVGGIPEVVRDGESGILAEPGNPADLARAIGRLVEDAPLRHTMGERGRARVEGYSWDAIFPRFMKVYQEALEERMA